MFGLIKIMEKIVQALKDGKIVIHNTDTCLGMAVDIMNEKAVELLYKVKQMDRSKPVSILCSDLDMASRYGFFPDKALELAGKYLPGALTLIVYKKNIPKWINPGMNTIGVRIPDDEFSLSMARELGNPVTTTSCNISGDQVCLSETQVRAVFGESIANGEVVVAFDGETHPKVSTIVKVLINDTQSTKDADLEIVRQGVVKIIP